MIEELKRRTAAGERVKYVFFWGHQPRRDGAECLSQWAPSPFTVGDVRFATAEHYMMWRKAMLFGDERTAARVLDATHPKQAKDLGRQVRGFAEQAWLDARYGIVVDGNLAKFRQHPAMGDYLTGTKDRVLVEASPLDRVWGIGLAADDPRAQDPHTWRGLNLLGFALMDVRRQL
ncbi:NADAR family protein [Catenuloplanes indicus]|uniref:RibA/ribD-fused uncharacterized protein n=1 Tax=Catenuloplanes indicus TaxID=137267 RepID=A0AAE3VYX9_9ACTN|nr:NADAR family protein [Catenuloplanes indicus]MDQ0365872.1 ribA/ribD-fused uncharacterized protein [Catenuloplanes indicus]